MNRLSAKYFLIISLFLTGLVSGQKLPAKELSVSVLKDVSREGDSFTQGLEFDSKGRLWESTGQYGQSFFQLRSKDLKSLEKKSALPENYFGEGLTKVGNYFYQLTWRSKNVLRWDSQGRFRVIWKLPGEGWGLTHYKNTLVYSDGSDSLHFLNPQTGKRTQNSLLIRYQGNPVQSLNELELIPLKGHKFPWVILANIWRTTKIAVIAPNGEVLEIWDLDNIHQIGNPRNHPNNVLNGIAWHPQKGLWVTGKYWQKLFQIKVPQSLIFKKK